MVFSKFRLHIVVRIAAILLLGYLSVYVVLYTHFWLVGLWTTLFAILLVVNLISFIERSNRELANFLMAIKQGDFSNNYNYQGSSRYGLELRKAFGDILQVFQNLSTERETNHLFLQTVVEHVSIALVTFDEDGELISVNKAAKELFNKPHLKNLQSIRSSDEKLYTRLKEIKSDQGELVKTLSNGELKNLSLRATSFYLKDRKYKIVSLQDIKSELEQNEVESWQKLIRVLTHEIMNSAIPISTLSSVISQMIEDDDGKLLPLSEVNEDVGHDLHGGLKTIESRSKGLVRFVDAFKSLTKIAPPKFEEIKLAELVNGVNTLMSPNLKSKRVENQIKVDDHHVIKGDRELLEQVLINLVKNAIEALEGTSDARITFESQEHASGRVLLLVSDNGPGIDEENLDNIFIPFFSTKKNGSGIGLSLSRQIMRLHRGSISVNSQPDHGTTFSLSF